MDNWERLKFALIMLGITDKEAKKGMEYATQSGVELRFNPSQDDIDFAIAEAYLRGYLEGKKDGL